MSSLGSNIPSSLTPLSKSQSRNACLSCRNGKVKCKISLNSETCERCRRNSFSCVFERHRRGRKFGTRLKRAAQSTPPLPYEPSISNSPNGFPSTNQHRPRDSSIINTESQDEIQTETPSYNTEWGSAGLQPVSILSKEAQSGKFSLENILCVPDGLEPSHPAASAEGANNRDDPIMNLILTFPVALGLFENFMRCMNPYVSQLDPKLHSFVYVRQKSSFLLTTVLSVSSKAFHPSLHPALRSHSEKLLGDAFVRGTKSTEVVQGIMIFTYWKEPDEMRTWLLVGYAIRMGIEIGWHELESHPTSATSNRDEYSVREKRNIERTWLVLFVYDRSLSLQLGKPWMIEAKGIILNADTWWDHEFAVPGADLINSAFACLRLTSAEMLQLASPSRSAFDRPRGEVLSKMLNTVITAWEQKWLPLFKSDEIPPCHRFMANFYGLHVRLLLNSYSLQASLLNVNDGSDISKSALWLCSSSAIGMLEQISEEFGPFKQLYFVQDSIHVMVAYAAIFLVKLLVSLPISIRSDFEPHSIQAILKAAETFEQQCATQMTGAAMQARFLKSVIQKYENLKSQSPATPAFERGYTSRDSQHSTFGVSNDGHVSSNTQNHGNNSEFQTGPIPQTQSVLGTNLFADKDLWDSLFSDVVFGISDGVSLSENPSTI